MQSLQCDMLDANLKVQKVKQYFKDLLVQHTEVQCSDMQDTINKAHTVYILKWLMKLHLEDLKE